MIIYTVEEIIGDGSQVHFVFSTQKKADKVCEELNALDRSIYVSDKTYYVVRDYELEN